MKINSTVAAVELPQSKKNPRRRKKRKKPKHQSVAVVSSEMTKEVVIIKFSKKLREAAEIATMLSITNAHQTVHIHVISCK